MAVRRDTGQYERDVVLAAPGERRDQRVADGVQVPVFPGERRPQRDNALVEVTGPAFHQPVGVQGQDRARRELDPGLSVEGRAEPQRLARRQFRDSRGAVGQAAAGNRWLAQANFVPSLRVTTWPPAGRPADSLPLSR